MSSGRAVITGVGAVAPSGIGLSAHWKSVVAGDNHIGPITLFDASPYPATLAGEVTGFDKAGHVESRIAAQTDRWTWLGFAATGEALTDAALDLSELDPYELSVALASSTGGNLFGQKELQRLWGRPTRTVSAYQSIAWFYAASVGQLSIKHQFKGPSSVLCAESAGGLDSLGQAGRTVRRGTSVVLAGGTECPLSPYALVCQLRSGRISTRTDPDRAYLPFDVDAAGHVPAEGGAVFVVEDLDHALSRGAPVIHAEIAGWAATHDGRATRRGESGPVEHYARAMRLALERAELDPSEVDLVLPDAAGVPEDDAVEAAALRAVFGSAGPTAVTTQKPNLGRAYQGGAALDVATGLAAMRESLIPPARVGRPAPGCELRFVREPTATPVDVVMVNARGFDGFNSSVVLRRYRNREIS